jgi:hypothetical protein
VTINGRDEYFGRHERAGCRVLYERLIAEPPGRRDLWADDSPTFEEILVHDQAHAERDIPTETLSPKVVQPWGVGQTVWERFDPLPCVGRSLVLSSDGCRARDGVRRGRGAIR